MTKRLALELLVLAALRYLQHMLSFRALANRPRTRVCGTKTPPLERRLLYASTTDSSSALVVRENHLQSDRQSHCTGTRLAFDSVSATDLVGQSVCRARKSSQDTTRARCSARCVRLVGARCLHRQQCSSRRGKQCQSPSITLTRVKASDRQSRCFSRLLRYNRHSRHRFCFSLGVER